MNITPPKKIVLIISLILFIVSLAAHIVNIPLVTQLRYWIILAAYVLLAAGVVIKRF